MDLKGTVSIVTGGNGGLGRTICDALAREGSNVAVVYKASKDDAEGVASALQRYDVRATAYQADVTNLEDIQSLYQRVLADYGQIDILVNNAAYNQSIAFSDLEGLTPDVWNHILHANATGPFLCSRAIAPIMKRQGRGRIVNVSSVAGFTPSGSSIAYAVSKSALNHLTRCLAVALAPEIIVNCVAPGLMEGTRMTTRLVPAQVKRAMETAALQKAADKEDVAAQVVTFCKTESITGQTMVIDAGRFYH
ncbi:MAG: SDR family oxidoreductase [Chloroflexota bacterium]